MSAITRCEHFLTDLCGGRAFLTPSCTAALELACLVMIERGDEVIMPSFTFPSTANAVILRGGVPVFVDSRMDTLNIDPLAVRAAVTARTKAIMPVHYAGVPCDMAQINGTAEEFGLWVIEDAAQAIGNWRITGHVGCLSFHDTKNVGCGEGGALIVRDPQLLERIEIVRDCGTTKAKWRRGESSTWDWLEVGQSALMSEYCAQVLECELQRIDEITHERLAVWDAYHRRIEAEKSERRGNGHIFWFRTEVRDRLRSELAGEGIKIASHYEAAHLTAVGRRYGRVGAKIVNAQIIAETIARPPMSVQLSEATRIAERINLALDGGRQIKAA